MAGETEKITMNLGPVDLGQIDLLVQEGVSTRIAPTSSVPRSVTNWPPMPRPSGRLSPARH